MISCQNTAENVFEQVVDSLKNSHCIIFYYGHIQLAIYLA